jgi:hypothetical protein
MLIGDILFAIGMLAWGMAEVMNSIQALGRDTVGATWIVTGVAQGRCWEFGMLGRWK